jgi:phosphoribosylformimino-5-aminoimidazole carboxamide ribonucleotide (ProFAR) isomerase
MISSLTFRLRAVVDPMLFLEGAIVGTALYDGRIDLGEAQQTLAAPRGA